MKPGKDVMTDGQQRLYAQKAWDARKNGPNRDWTTLFTPQAYRVIYGVSKLDYCKWYYYHEYKSSSWMEWLFLGLVLVTLSAVVYVAIF